MDAKNLVVWALEASMHVEPRRPGLTPGELVELGAAFGVDADHVHFQIRGRATEGDRVLPFGVDPSMFGTYAGDLRSLAAFDHVVASLNEAHRTAAGGDAWASRESIVAAAAAAGLPRADVEYAVAMYRAFDGIPGADDRWVLRRVKPAAVLPSAQRAGPAGIKVTRREGYADLVQRLRAIMERRSGAAPRAAAPAAPPPAAPVAPPPPPPDPAPSSQEAPPDAAPHDDPLVAFGALLPALGQQRLVPWWSQLTGEYREASTLTRCLLAAWMAEAALRIACRHAGLPRPDPKATRPVRLSLNELARAATAIGFDAPLRARIERLSKIRQRIQSSRLFDETGAWSALTAEDARDASATLDATVGAVLAWQGRSSGAR